MRPRLPYRKQIKKKITRVQSLRIEIDTRGKLIKHGTNLEGKRKKEVAPNDTPPTV